MLSVRQQGVEEIKRKGQKKQGKVRRGWEILRVKPKGKGGGQ